MKKFANVASTVVERTQSRKLEEETLLALSEGEDEEDDDQEAQDNVEWGALDESSFNKLLSESTETIKSNNNNMNIQSTGSNSRRPSAVSNNSNSRKMSAYKNGEGVQLTELEICRNRLKRRNVLIGEIRKAYLRDVVVLKRLLEELLQKDERNNLLTQWKKNIPSIDLRQFLMLLSPEEASINIIPCEACGGTVEIVHHDSSEIEKLVKELSSLDKNKDELRVIIATKTVQNEALEKKLAELSIAREEEKRVLFNQLKTMKENYENALKMNSYYIEQNSTMKSENAVFKALSGEHQNLVDLLHAAEVENQRLSTDLRKADDALVYAKDHIKLQTEKLNKQIKENESLNKKLSENVEELEKASDGLGKSKAQVDTYQKRNNKLQNLLDASRKEVEELIATRNGLQIDLEQSQAQSTKDIEKLEAMCDKLREENSALLSKVKTLQAELLNKHNDNVSYQQKLKEKESTSATAITHMENEIAMLKKSLQEQINVMATMQPTQLDSSQIEQTKLQISKLQKANLKPRSKKDGPSESKKFAVENTETVESEKEEVVDVFQIEEDVSGTNNIARSKYKVEPRVKAPADRRVTVATGGSVNKQKPVEQADNKSIVRSVSPATQVDQDAAVIVPTPSQSKESTSADAIQSKPNAVEVKPIREALLPIVEDKQVQESVTMMKVVDVQNKPIDIVEERKITVMRRMESFADPENVTTIISSHAINSEHTVAMIATKLIEDESLSQKSGIKGNEPTRQLLRQLSSLHSVPSKSGDQLLKAQESDNESNLDDYGINEEVSEEVAITWGNFMKNLSTTMNAHVGPTASMKASEAIAPVTIEFAYITAKASVALWKALQVSKQHADFHSKWSAIFSNLETCFGPEASLVDVRRCSRITRDLTPFDKFMDDWQSGLVDVNLDLIDAVGRLDWDERAQSYVPSKGLTYFGYDNMTRQIKYDDALKSILALREHNENARNEMENFIKEIIHDWLQCKIALQRNGINDDGGESDDEGGYGSTTMKLQIHNLSNELAKAKIDLHDAEEQIKLLSIEVVKVQNASAASINQAAEQLKTIAIMRDSLAEVNDALATLTSQHDKLETKEASLRKEFDDITMKLKVETATNQRSREHIEKIEKLLSLETDQHRTVYSELQNMKELERRRLNDLNSVSIQYEGQNVSLGTQTEFICPPMTLKHRISEVNPTKRVFFPVVTCSFAGREIAYNEPLFEEPTSSNDNPQSRPNTSSTKSRPSSRAKLKSSDNSSLGRTIYSSHGRDRLSYEFGIPGVGLDTSSISSMSQLSLSSSQNNIPAFPSVQLPRSNSMRVRIKTDKEDADNQSTFNRNNLQTR